MSGAQRAAPSSSLLAQTAGDMSVLALIAVVAIILIVSVAVSLIAGTLCRIVNRAGRKSPKAECAAWLRARQSAYLGKNGGLGAAGPLTNPGPGAPHTGCEAAALDSEGGARPIAPPSPSPLLQDPYARYLAGQR